jgi:hypothetical protein
VFVRLYEETPMAITFETKYPTALKNAAWQSKKSFKDKAKSKTKTGLGEALTTAEKDWAKIKFDNLIAARQGLEGKNLLQKAAAKKTAREYLDGPVVTKAMESLEAAASKARVTAKNAALSTSAVKAATALSGPLLAQARLLHDIKLDDFEPPTQDRRDIGRWENQHTEYVRSLDNIRDDLKEKKDKATWDESHVGTIVEDAVKVSAQLAEATGEKHWKDNNERWRRLLISYAATDRLVKSMPGTRVGEEIDTFADLIQGTMGGMWA